MPKPPGFWRNVALIGVAHGAVIAGLIHWSGASKTGAAQSIVWMGGSADTRPAPTKDTSFVSTAKLPMQKAELPTAAKEREQEEDRPIVASANSEIELPAAKPSPKPTATPRETAMLKVNATPRTAAKPKPRPTVTPKPKTSPKKLLLAKASPQHTPAPQPIDKAENAERSRLEKSPLPSALPTSSKDEPAKAAIGSAGRDHSGASSGESQFAWYGSMLHDRFYSEWVQPTNITAMGAKSSVLAKLRIEKDGRVSNFQIIKASGNTDVDESVAAVGKRVTQVDPLPPGLGDGEHYEVKINFELSSE